MGPEEDSHLKYGKEWKEINASNWEGKDINSKDIFLVKPSLGVYVKDKLLGQF